MYARSLTHKFSINDSHCHRIVHSERSNLQPFTNAELSLFLSYKTFQQLTYNSKLVSEATVITDFFLFENCS